MIYKIYPLSQYFQIDAFGVVACLVRVHGYAGSEQYCRNAVLDEDSLVGEPVEYFGEVLASIIVERDVHVQAVESVGDVDHLLLDRLE